MSTEASVKYPSVKVRLTGSDGNAFAVLGKVVDAMRAKGVPAEEISAFKTEAMSGDYDNLLATCMRWVNVT